MNKKVKRTEIQPGMLLFEPDHKAGVVAALTGYFRSKKRKQGYRRPNKQRKSTGGDAGHPVERFKTLDRPVDRTTGLKVIRWKATSEAF